MWIAKVLIITKLLGIGVITGTVFVHILPDAIESFGSECVDIDGGYGIKYVGLITMISAFLANLLQTFGHKHEVIDAIESSECRRASTATITSERKWSAQISAIILEMGILLHSVIIGISLGTCSDSNLISLTIAISFHQFFEGLALGVIVGDTNLEQKIKYLLGFMYPISTPLGIVIGILSRIRMDTTQILIFKGVFNSISCGILIYNIYAELMVNQIIGNDNLKRQSRWFRVTSYFGMYFGAGFMAVLALWA